MNTTDIIANNKLIAEFMGWKQAVNDGTIQLYYYPNNNTGEYNHTCVMKHICAMYYPTSWDALIPVLLKIQSLVCKAEFTNRIGNHLRKFDIKSCVEGAVEYIKWYNKQNQ